MTKPGLTLHRLRLFLAVLDHGGIARAAAKENISQPAVSEHIRGLEEHFGVRLVARVGRGICPTAAARQIEPYARQIVKLLQSAEQVASDIQGIQTGSLTVGASSTPGTYLLPHALGRFRAQYPAVSLQLRIRNTTQVEKWVASGEVELGVIGDSHGLNDSYAAEPWLEDELLVLLNEHHPLAGHASIAPDILATEPFVAREEGSSTWRAAGLVFRQLGLTLAPVMEMGSTEAIREAVAAGLGIALVSKYATAQRDPRVVVARLTGVQLRRRFTVIRRANTPLGPAAARFRDVLFQGGADEKVVGPNDPLLLTHSALT
jgi:LysR family transcriptional regulator, low CO2-responsive transcriptional regulator